MARAIQTGVAIGRGRSVFSLEALALPRLENADLTVIVGPVREAYPALGNKRGAAIVLIRDPQQRQATVPQYLRDLYGLTAAEGALVVALADGHSLEQVSEQRATSLNTLRTQLKSAMGKVGANRQGELIAIVLRSVAAMGGR